MLGEYYQQLLSSIINTKVERQYRENMNLNELLSDPHISVPELFQQPDILNMIKYKLATFVEFCKHNEQFTNIMITLGIKTPMHRHENIQMRKISHIASDILTCDNDNIADLFVLDETQPRIRCYSEDDDEILEEIVSNQATGQLTITDRTPSKEQKETNQFNKKYKYLLDLLSYLNEPTPDQNCVNYMIKVFNTVVRVKPEQMFVFFRQKPQIMKKMIEFTNFPSVSYSIAKIINEGQDKKYREFKVEVVNMVIKEILGKLDCSNFHVYAEFVQEVFDKNRHRGQEQDQLKIATQSLVDKQIINAILASVLSDSSPPQRVGNSLLYLLKVCERMNIDEEQDPYSYNEPNTNKPTMDFQVDELYKNYQGLLQLAPRINRSKYTSTQILVYYELLLAIAKNSRFKNVEIDRISNILTLLKVLNINENGFNGIVKNKIVFLIQVIYHHGSQSTNSTLTSSTSSTLAEATNTEKYEDIHNEIEKLTQNKTQALCYKEKLHLLFGTSIDRMIINEVHTKYSGVLAPTNYTENRNYKVKQLQFVKLHINRYNRQDNVGEVQEKPISNGSDEKLEEHVITDDGKRSQSNGTGFNLNLLNSKIHAIKTKRVKQEEEQANKAKQQQAQQAVQKFVEQVQEVQRVQLKQEKLNQKQQVKQQEVVVQQSQQQSKVQELPEQSKTNDDQPKQAKNKQGKQTQKQKPKQEKQKPKQEKQKQKQKQSKAKENDTEKPQKQNQSKGDSSKFYVKYLMLF